MRLRGWRVKSAYSSLLKKPITRSTPARLYPLRSSSTITPRGLESATQCGGFFSNAESTIANAAMAAAR